MTTKSATTRKHASKTGDEQAEAIPYELITKRVCFCFPRTHTHTHTPPNYKTTTTPTRTFLPRHPPRLRCRPRVTETERGQYEILPLNVPG
jgi:hypothetical protein